MESQSKQHTARKRIIAGDLTLKDIDIPLLYGLVRSYNCNKKRIRRELGILVDKGLDSVDRGLKIGLDEFASFRELMYCTSIAAKTKQYFDLHGDDALEEVSALMEPRIERTIAYVARIL